MEAVLKRTGDYFGTTFHRKPVKLGHSTLGRLPRRNSRGYQALKFIQLQLRDIVKVLVLVDLILHLKLRKLGLIWGT